MYPRALLVFDIVESECPVVQSIQCMITTHPNILTGMELGPTLTNKDVATQHTLACNNIESVMD